MARKWRLLILRVQFSLLRTVKAFLKKHLKKPGFLEKDTHLSLFSLETRFLGKGVGRIKKPGFLEKNTHLSLFSLETRFLGIPCRILLFILSALFGFTSALSLPALSAYQIAAEQQTTAQTSEAWGLVRKAQELSEASKLAEAEEEWLKAAQSFLKECQQENMLKSLINRAEALRTLGFDRRAFNTLITGLQLHNQSCQEIENLIQEQPDYLSQSDFRDQDNLAEQLENILQDQPSSTVAQSLHSLGKVLRELGNFPESIRVLQKSLQYAQTPNSSLDKSAILLDIGNTRVSQGQEKINQQESAQQLIIELAVYAESKKRTIDKLPDILTSFERCDVDDSSKQRICNSVIGGGYYQLALDAYQQAEETASATTQLKATLNRLSLLLDIRTTLTQAINKANEIVSREQREFISTRLPWDSSIKPELDTDIQRLTSQIDQELAYQINQPTLLSKSNIDFLLNFTEIITKTSVPTTPSGNWSFLPQLEQVLDENSKYSQKSKLIAPRSRAFLLGNLGKIYEQQQAYDQGKYYTERGLKLAGKQEKPDPYLTYILRWQLGRILKAQDNLLAARVNYEAAFDNLEILRKDIAENSKNLQFDFKEELEPVYRDLVGLLLPEKSNATGERKKGWGNKNVVDAGTRGRGDAESRHPTQNFVHPNATTATKSMAKPQAATEDDIKKAINVIESLRLAELENYFQDPCSIEGQAKVDIDQLIDDNEQASKSAIIYPIVLDEQENIRIVVLLKLPGEPITYENKKVPKSEFDNNLEELKNIIYVNSRNIVGKKVSLQNRVDELNEEEETTEATIQQRLQKLYDWLIRIIDLRDFQKGTLVFVPDSKLRSVPLAALYDGEQYLIEQYSIALAPGLRLTNPQLLPRENAKVLLGGNEIEFQAVARELTAIEEAFPNNLPLRNAQLTKDNLETELQSSFDIVHLATHSQFSPDLANTRIELWEQDAITFEEFEDLLQARNLDPIKLLVLSSCETSAGNDRAVLGLAGVAVRTGASSTVATLWPVEDETAAEVMIKFYQELANKPDSTLAEALRQAQLKMLTTEIQYESQNNERIKADHPFFWAGYVVVGNWL
ncbi:MAG: CHAT domain-containing protein [Symploca sp. SIO2E6]|nr:CHAT domain-containing protein [Symploca sp. SIO2E6]